MPFVVNFPFFCIIFTMAGGIICSVLNGKRACNFTIANVFICFVLSVSLLFYMWREPQEITYLMGHFSAPWGNEIRFGPLEVLMATVITFGLLLVIIIEKRRILSVIEPHKTNLFFIMVNLMLSSLNALIYTNDLFTSYVFIEINTLCACGFMIARENGKTIAATIKYLIMSLLGSGLFLISIVLLYDLTGHLLMPNVGAKLSTIIQSGAYQLPVTIIIGLLAVSMAIKSALFPFHSWMGHAYDNAKNFSNAISSGLVVKGYIILLIKIFYRVIGIENVSEIGANQVLFVLGIFGIIVGSFDALRERSIKRMLAYSSVGQIGYIYVGIGLATPASILAACYIVIAHSLTKTMLFLSAEELMAVSNRGKYFEDLRGSAYRNPLAAICFTVGAFSMIGFPLLSGFIGKYLLTTSAMLDPIGMWFVLIAVAISTIFNASYFIRFIIRIYNKDPDNATPAKIPIGAWLGLLIFLIANFAVGFFYQPIIEIIRQGLLVL